jgi:hypothetical protein
MQPAFHQVHGVCKNGTPLVPLLPGRAPWVAGVRLGCRVFETRTLHGVALSRCCGPVAGKQDLTTARTVA